MKYIDAEKLIKFKEALADIIVSSQGICTYQDCKDIAEREASLLISTLRREQPEVDLDAIVNEAFDKYSSVDGYGQLSVSFNRAELYSFIKEIARKED